ncbi:DUF6132 family protein [Capnocytophaga canis]|uniref:DUF6132 family protein n=1 Tax=Capnocytophaga canis TaxID=1848903 RepID=UPI001562CA05|nr:DUF6132 family protein [Capnocytophaga canis]
MKKFVKKHLLTLIGVAVGALAGYFYWQQIGCNSGTCAITSNPVNSTLYGSVMGGLLFSMFKREKNRTDDISGNN